MADLDDFFAKKDKKKSKKTQFVTPEILLKNLEETTKRDVKPKKATPTTIGDAEDENKPKVEEQDSEEEWREYEEQRKDYTGLKIGQLILNPDDDDKSDGGEDGCDGDNNTNTDTNSAVGCPWKNVAPNEGVPQVQAEMPKKEGIYRPPALLMAMKSKKSKAAPDLSNAEYFPTLGAVRMDERKKKNEPAFEDVRNGSRMQKVKEPILAPRGVNRFQSLDEVES